MAETTSPKTVFDPGQHLTKVKGNDYLETRWRIAWFRDVHPDGVIETTLNRVDGERVVFYARVTTTDGATATGWGSCTESEFPAGHYEKAETKALGRALAALGYGTQFAGDDFSDATGPLADTPPHQYQQGQGNPGDAVATNAQRSMIQFKAREAMLEPDRLVQIIREQTGTEFNSLTKRQASKVIDYLGTMAAPPQR